MQIAVDPGAKNVYHITQNKMKKIPYYIRMMVDFRMNAVCCFIFPSILLTCFENVFVN